MTAPRGKKVGGPKSRSRAAFFDNSDDIRSLFTLHQIAKNNPAVSRHLQVADKGMYLLIAALWETYCESLVTESARHLAFASSSHTQLPKDLRKAIATHARKAADESTPWRLADDGWRTLIVQRAEELSASKANSNPRAGTIDTLFKEALGLADLSQSWHSPRVHCATTALDEHLDRRGALAHTASAVKVTKADVSLFYQLTKNLTESTDARVGEFLEDHIGKNPYADTRIVEAG